MGSSGTVKLAVRPGLVIGFVIDGKSICFPPLLWIGPPT